MGAIQAVIKGDKDVKELSDTQAKSALSEVLGKLGKAKENMAKTTEQVGEAVMLGANVAETQGTSLLVSAVQGYRGGAEHMKLGGKVHVGAAVGLPMVGVGIVRAMMGKNDASHIVGVGQGFLAPAVVALGEEMGAALKQKWAKKDAGAGAGAGAGAPPQAPPEVNSAGQKLQRNADGSIAVDASGQPVYAGFRDVRWQRPQAPHLPSPPPEARVTPAMPDGARLRRARALSARDLAAA